MTDASRIAFPRQFIYLSFWSVSPYCSPMRPHCPPYTAWSSPCILLSSLSLNAFSLSLNASLGLLAAVAASVSATVSILLIVLVSDGLAWHPHPDRPGGNWRVFQQRRLVPRAGLLAKLATSRVGLTSHLCSLGNILRCPGRQRGALPGHMGHAAVYNRLTK